MKLSAEDRAVLAHVVVDPDDWMAHARKTVGVSAITAKIEAHRHSYLAAIKRAPKSYKPRAEREAEVEKELQALATKRLAVKGLVREEPS